MPYRNAHGRSAELGQTLVFENAHQDPTPRLPAGSSGEVQRDAGGRVRGKDAAARLARMRGRAPRFVDRELTCTPAFAPFNDQRAQFARQRIAEIVEQTGHASRGVCALVRAHAWGISFGEFLAAQAAESGDADTMAQAMAVLAKASVEGEKARRLAIEEAAARPKSSNETPWLVPSEAK